MEIRKLQASEVECRPAQAGKTKAGKVWVSVLLYKSARVDMQILDEMVGSENWTRTHREINGVIYCSVGIRKAGGDWVFKEDCGSESNIEKEKGAASDAFKRACVNWGIGRELYSAPTIFIELRAGEYSEGADGKIYPKARFSVDRIGYSSSGEIITLSIIDSKGEERFSWYKE